ncbi:MAG: hypothetical protein IKL16_01115 [Clostridia bacterium]|nr:hypothetical protein [Clostridia bacterium]
MTKMKKFCIILVAIVVFLGFASFCIDSSRINNGNPPIFVVDGVAYRDGGSKEYIGLGYKVIKYNVIGENGKIVKDNYEIGSYFLRVE